MKNRTKTNSGITLVALVVTVIVLLILAGVSIGLVFNSDGLFSKASDSAKRYNQKKAQEALTLVLSNATMKKYSPEGLTNEELDNMIKDIGGIIDPEDPNKVTVDGYDFEIDRDKLEVTDSLGENPNITPGGGGSGGGNQGSEEGNKKEESTLTLSATSGTITYPDTTTFEITENTSNGNLSVSSSDDSIASASISGNIVTITPKSITESEKEAIITVKSAETEKYKEQTAIYIATIKQGGITINAVPNVREYDGTAFDALLSVTVTPTDAVVEYSLNEGAYQSEIPQIKEAGQYTITIKASKDGYVTKEESITVTVSKQSSTTGNLALSENKGTVTYPNTKTFDIIKNISEGELSVSSSNENAVTASISGNTVTLTPKAISTTTTVTITVKSAATSNYEEQIIVYSVNVIGNSEPVFAQASTISKGWNSSTQTTNFTVTAKATDADTSDTLTYTVYMKPATSAESEYKVVGSSSATTQGQNATINVTQYNGANLANYTDYNWKVAVTDGKVSSLVQEGKVNTTKTYCKTFSCSVGYRNRVNCTGCSYTGKVSCSSCGGSGSVTRLCGGIVHGSVGVYDSSISSCPFGLSGCTGTSGQHGIIKIDNCSIGGTAHNSANWSGPWIGCLNCARAKFFEISGSGKCKFQISSNCSTCSGTGKVTHSTCSGNGYYYNTNTCGHGYQATHWWCEDHHNTSAYYHE